ncbi:uncharacterized protein BT62DRAFT_932424 [Guyanagaster necrorhizus]|uniref:Uncharacterized protein n=1 Tax=Guyanagaster necrorhizus TaxID=856835 RepID=A0A9P8ASF4_9AGAR|nr:uncharacterized protein BT62DRAFT_932424 [Guyanagaster necrorhizus MCA 3950]KAG7446075.1 hypothetical protein BT62DRAFT_932424 [Guyanagaster necrorhizus MCA 3950]
MEMRKGFPVNCVDKGVSEKISAGLGIERAGDESARFVIGEIILYFLMISIGISKSRVP